MAVLSDPQASPARLFRPQAERIALAFPASIAYQPRIEPMKMPIPILALLTVACLCTAARADDDAARQFQQEQDACQTDAYTFCNDAIPDQERIAACLRKHWSEISPECRKVMSIHRRRHR
jgi:hypothetical protein